MLFPSFFHGFATAQGQRQLRGTGSISPGPEDPRVVDQGSHEGGEVCERADEVLKPSMFEETFWG